MQVRGARVLITGASRGIGEQAARRFAEAGATVALAARSAGPIEALADELGGAAYPVDLADAAQVAGFIEQVEADGPLDVLINNAGVEDIGLLTDTDEAAIDQLLALNVATPFKLAGQVLPGMIERGVGQIVQISSLAALSPIPAMVAYTASKAALTHGTGSLELELRGTGVQLTTVHLGIIETEMGLNVNGSELLTEYFARLDKLGSPGPISADDVARALVDAVAKDRRHVILPKTAAVFAGLNNAPRRITGAILKGMKFR
jgi:short-subunit dehydrogenase